MTPHHLVGIRTSTERGSPAQGEWSGTARLIRHRGLADLGLLEGGHHLGGEPFELFEAYRFRHADG